MRIGIRCVDASNIRGRKLLLDTAEIRYQGNRGGLYGEDGSGIRVCAPYGGRRARG